MATTSPTYLGSWQRWNYSTDIDSGTSDTTWTNWSTTSATRTYNDSTSDSTVWYNWHNDFDRQGKQLDLHIDYGQNETAVWSVWITDQELASAGSQQGYRDFIQNKVDESAKKLSNWKVPSTEALRASKAQAKIRNEWNKILTKERVQAREEAEFVAQDLLLDIVGEDELQRYNETGRLFVRGKEYDYVLQKGGGVHRIEKDKVIDFLKKKEATGRYICVHPKGNFNFPETDNVITLKLWIENNEEKFLGIGNMHKGHETIANFDRVVNL